jgi:hypothetical protein
MVYGAAIVSAISVANRLASSEFGNAVLENAKLIASRARDHLSFLNTVAQSLGHSAQKDVPDRMAQRVMDDLELIQVKKKPSQPSTALVHTSQRSKQLFAEEHTVSEACQRVIMHHIADSCFRRFRSAISFSSLLFASISSLTERARACWARLLASWVSTRANATEKSRGLTI